MLLTGEKETLLTKHFPLFSDERDAIQKKTFTKWVNKHLKKVSVNKSIVFNMYNLISICC